MSSFISILHIEAANRKPTQAEDLIEVEVEKMRVHTANPFLYATLSPLYLLMLKDFPMLLSLIRNITWLELSPYARVGSVYLLTMHIYLLGISRNHVKRRSSRR